LHFHVFTVGHAALLDLSVCYAFACADATHASAFTLRADRPFARARTRAEARWRSGYAEDCKSLHAGSIPARASNSFQFALPSNPARPSRTSWSALKCAMPARCSDWT